MSNNSVNPSDPPDVQSGGKTSRNSHLWKWLPWALLGFFWWGLFGFIAKVGSADVDARDMQVLFTLGTLPLVFFILVRRKGMRNNRKGRIIGLVIGLIAGLGNAAYFVAMSRGQASLVGPVTSLFPLVTVLLATIVLKERFNRVQAAGVVLAIISAVLLAT
ncbi:MAG: DMT family transporter [Bryobacteraceae bacterium]